MIGEIVISGFFLLYFVITYLSKKMNTIKTVGICKEILNATRACEGIFEYEIDGIYHYNAESSSHVSWLKEGKKYTIYVKKDNHEKFVSIKVLIELLFLTSLEGIILILQVILVVYDALY